MEQYGDTENLVPKSAFVLSALSFPSVLPLVFLQVGKCVMTLAC